ncbi:GH92 family glycosyl hydrolase [Sabulilitoribacter arenilitoris]|uniref:GH92 family glycosyl hydrolase n=1 Tax=Wocania arenilitoris TaxID=2044858 RepID=A0AAE3JP32_9FLAO|nr:GH92 family glycosyl hydrolase [Wocania arenilitoris]MCF7567850.1 GH92 family glycosyl hydrolase [Wocania arenilitoris]
MIKSKHKRNYLVVIGTVLITIYSYSQKPVDFVNPFIGTSNYGATNPGAIAPRGMASVSPFNVAGPQNLPLEKDSRWLSNPYVNENIFLTGFSHVNLSGVGCPDLGVILTMPTTGELKTNHLEYGSTYNYELAKPGYYSVQLSKYKIKTEVTATTRVGVSKYYFPKGQSNILINLGLGLTNEEGATVKVVSPTEIEGIRNVGSFCYYKPEESYPVYFVVKFSKPADDFGVWKKTRKYDGIEAQWMPYNGNTRLYKNYRKEIIGDSIGSYFTYYFDKPTQVEVKVGVSYVSIENARENLDKETQDLSFDAIYRNTASKWNDLLSKIEVEGGTKDDKIIFYTALYHTLIHPNTLNDVNGEYPTMAKRETAKTNGTRFTVFSFWDTYRNLHALMSLVYPKQQSDMVKSMLNIYDESGWLPKWELNATETTTMVGDPAGIVLADTYLRGIQDFDIEKAYEAMRKSATQLENNPLRPGIKDYIKKGYLTTKTTKSGSVSTTQEYNISDFAIAQLATALGKKNDSKLFYKRSISYRKLFDREFNLLRPKNDDGSWHSPFNPNKGANFEKNLGFIEGNSWQYTFMVTHDARVLIKLMGGTTKYVNKLDEVFEKKQYDMANEPDIAYPYLYNYAKGYEWKTQQRVTSLINKYFTNNPAGLPGNDDTGTMSAWLIYSMMGIYPISPAEPVYTITAPRFDKITIHLDNRYYLKDKLVIEKKGTGNLESFTINGKAKKSFFINHSTLTNASKIQFNLKE